MSDFLSQKERSIRMSAVKARNTKFEERGFEFLREAGVRFRKHPKGIIGNPDAANKSRKIVFFFDSHFWHGYDVKGANNLRTRKKFWKEKIKKNIRRDRKVNALLRSTGWVVVRLWEHELNNKNKIKTLKKIIKTWNLVLQTYY